MEPIEKDDPPNPPAKDKSISIKDTHKPSEIAKDEFSHTDNAAPNNDAENLEVEDTQNEKDCKMIEDQLDSEKKKKLKSQCLMDDKELALFPANENEECHLNKELDFIVTRNIENLNSSAVDPSQDVDKKAENSPKDQDKSSPSPSSSQHVCSDANFGDKEKTIPKKKSETDSKKSCLKKAPDDDMDGEAEFNFDMFNEDSFYSDSEEFDIDSDEDDDDFDGEGGEGSSQRMEISAGAIEIVDLSSDSENSKEKEHADYDDEHCDEVEPCTSLMDFSKPRKPENTIAPLPKKIFPQFIETINLSDDEIEEFKVNEAEMKKQEIGGSERAAEVTTKKGNLDGKKTVEEENKNEVEREINPVKEKDVAHSEKAAAEVTTEKPNSEEKKIVEEENKNEVEQETNPKEKDIAHSEEAAAEVVTIEKPNSEENKNEVEEKETNPVNEKDIAHSEEIGIKRKNEELADEVSPKRMKKDEEKKDEPIEEATPF